MDDIRPPEGAQYTVRLLACAVGTSRAASRPNAVMNDDGALTLIEEDSTQRV